MIRYLMLLLVCVAVQTPTLLKASGGQEGGGGKGVFCESHGERTVESLDLWEAKNVWGYKIPASKDIQSEIKRVMPVWYSSLHEKPTDAPFQYRQKDIAMWNSWYHDDFLSRLNRIPSGTRLNPTNDTTLILQPPPNCKVVQVLVYIDEGADSGRILADGEFWDLLDDENKYAYYFHETIYKRFRDSYENYQSSDIVRKYVGALFSTDAFPSKSAKVRQFDKALECETTGSANGNEALFYVTEIKDQQQQFPVPKSNVYFWWLGDFGKFAAPVEYSGTTQISYETLAGVDTGGITADHIQINSIFNGFKVTITSDFHLEQRNSDGSLLRQPFTCKPITPIHSRNRSMRISNN